jgi:inner membrane protein
VLSTSASRRHEARTALVPLVSSRPTAPSPPSPRPTIDNVAHTLAGLALAEAGLRRKTALATTTLALAANLPDVDALVYLVGSGVDALAFRRGWTHGVLAMAVLPLVLAACMLAWDRLVRRRYGRRARIAVPAHAGWLLVAAAVGVWSHPLLDLLNTYGVRLLMPFSGRWFYGDALFIIDPWVWVALAAGVLLARWRARRARTAMALGRVRPTTQRDAPWAGRPARVALAAVAAYAVAMGASSRVGRALVERQAAPAADRAMVAPVPVTPLRRQVVRAVGDQYEVGVLAWGWAPRYTPLSATPAGRDVEGAAAAARTPDGAAFLSWSRFPRFTSERVGDSLRVRISDLRYADARGRGWASVVVTVPAEPPELP